MDHIMCNCQCVPKLNCVSLNKCPYIVNMLIWILSTKLKAEAWVENG
jgi:hypothetical protein